MKGKERKGTFRARGGVAVVWSGSAFTLGHASGYGQLTSARAPQFHGAPPRPSGAIGGAGGAVEQLTRPCYIRVISVSCAAKRRLKQSITPERCECSCVSFQR